jgi:hypothetical protein
MRSSFQSFVGMSFLAAVLTVTVGCAPPSVCGPPAVAASPGVIVLTETSPAYRTQLAAQNGALSPHMACRAEATISVMIAASDDASRVDPMGQGLPAAERAESPPTSSQGTPLRPGQQPPVGYSVASDPQLHAGSHTAMTQRGQYRVLGVGRGTDRDDCGKAAIHACNDAVDGYFQRVRTVRTPGVVCQLDLNQELCAASTK